MTCKNVFTAFDYILPRAMLEFWYTTHTPHTTYTHMHTYIHIRDYRSLPFTICNE